MFMCPLKNRRKWKKEKGERKWGKEGKDFQREGSVPYFFAGVRENRREGCSILTLALVVAAVSPACARLGVLEAERDWAHKRHCEDSPDALWPWIM